MISIERQCELCEKIFMEGCIIEHEGICEDCHKILADNGEKKEVKKVKMTTVAVDKHGKFYDLSKSHPSWEQAKKGNTEENIVVDAFTCTQEEANKIRKRPDKKK